jgi:hypothetical protein
VIFQQQPIDTTGSTKIQGAMTGRLDSDEGSSESETDSDEDMEHDDMHKLRQLWHAIRLKQPITVRTRGQFGGENQKHEVFIQKEFWGIEPPNHIMDLLQLAYKSLEILSHVYGTHGIPGSCTRTQNGVPREPIEITYANEEEALISRTDDPRRRVWRLQTSQGNSKLVWWITGLSCLELLKISQTKIFRSNWFTLQHLEMSRGRHTIHHGI